jgi:hypothetical protein
VVYYHSLQECAINTRVRNRLGTLSTVQKKLISAKAKEKARYKEYRTDEAYQRSGFGTGKVPYKEYRGSLSALMLRNKQGTKSTEEEACQCSC